MTITQLMRREFIRRSRLSALLNLNPLPPPHLDIGIKLVVLAQRRNSKVHGRRRMQAMGYSGQSVSQVGLIDLCICSKTNEHALQRRYKWRTHPERLARTRWCTRTSIFC